jgi:ElaB/YqjD/DUF883 family membrane-anchored ribosome-binding protein
MANDSEDLKKDIETLRATIEKLAKDVSSINNSLAEDLKTRAGRAADDVRDSARTVASEIGEKGRESAETIEKTVRDRPFQSLLVAFGTGLLLAQFLRKR